MTSQKLSVVPWIKGVSRRGSFKRTDVFEIPFSSNASWLTM